MKKLILLLMMSLSINMVAQEKLKLSVYQDVKSFTESTTDVLVKLKMTGKQDRLGYMSISPMFEYAELEGIYKRYAFDVGYSLNKLYIKNLEASISVNYGIQERWSKTFLVFGADAELLYKLTDNISLSILLQSVQRKDLLWAYEDRVIRFSGFAGITVEL